MSTVITKIVIFVLFPQKNENLFIRYHHHYYCYYGIEVAPFRMLALHYWGPEFASQSLHMEFMMVHQGWSAGTLVKHGPLDPFHMTIRV